MEVTIKENSWLGKIAAKKLGAQNVAIVLGKTIHLYNVTREEFLFDKKWVKHEMCHVNQFETNGYYTFIIKYLWESMKSGYYNNKYEIEAREAEEL
ncbi:MAG: DUF4157 domain-containing protein [Ginsengibacter sp.]